MRVEIRPGAAADADLVARVDDTLPAGEIELGTNELRVGALQGWGADGLRAAAAAAARSRRRAGGEIVWRAGGGDEVRALVDGTAYGAYDAGLRKGAYTDRRELTLVLDADDAVRPFAER